jgi:hypothetical protein
MFADDLGSVTNDQNEAEEAIRIVLSEADKLELKVNPRKSGILMLGTNLSNTDKNGELQGIPYVAEYKYLGTWVDGQLSVDPHLVKAKRKSDYQTRRLTPLRKELDLAFNVGLFKRLVTPNIRMIGVVYVKAKTAEREKTEIQFRKTFRSFCCLPWTSPNELVTKLIGDVATVLEGMSKVVEHKSQCRRLGIPKDYNLINWWKSQSKPLIKSIPRKITLLLR